MKCILAIKERGYMPSKTKFIVVNDLIERFERVLNKKAEEMQVTALEEFKALEPEIDSIIREGNTDWNVIQLIFDSLMKIALLTNMDENVGQKAQEFLRYMISMDIDNALPMVLYYNSIFDDEIDEITMTDFIDDSFEDIFRI